ncbi:MULTISPECIES: hypothetical protein [unclassified Paenibacillus]|uniref:hypothetical protein n=1 Tax=unclassified Paenibacillus TaxID=185978 RepID=UPI001AE8E972|nr:MULTISPECIES: hypothetical protein [unclassified Paenibacillus]MBP1154296.1 hypothetical protein [Paenibacillus sp. PvP091]MBP1170319.1 hypothetical protein [Paenibacillus sp. PvR098]MBP2441347.1 hypothetical protein [Paenibacillus sp. PvP052]
MKKASLILIILLCFSFITSQSAFALSCAPPRAPQEEMEFSQMVFKGTVVSQNRDKLHFEVAKAWKGDPSGKLTLNQNGWTEFKTGDEYVVFAGMEDGKLRPRLCGNTGLATGFNEDQLGEPIPMVQTSTGSGFTLALVVMLVLIGIVFLWWKKKRPRT